MIQVVNGGAKNRYRVALEIMRRKGRQVADLLSAIRNA